MIQNEHQNYLDEDGYPTDEVLQYIEDYDILERGVDGLLDLVTSLWNHGKYGYIREGDKLELHTLGWSGNESLIEALQKNWFWNLCWESSRRGGHYYFDNLNRFNK